ncbi:MAG: hypothetical protein Q9195_001963 [Heterodermia aff. obscurata]
MHPLRRPATRILSRLPRPHQRRPASSEGSGLSSGHADSAGQAHPTSHDHHPEPVNESLGRGFYLALAAIPASFALYKLSRSSSDDPASQPWLTRVMLYYDSWREDWKRRNLLHTAAVEQAAHDRHLFYGVPRTHIVELRAPEAAFHAGSPFNVPAGSQANLDELMAFYRRERDEAQAKRERKAQAIYERRESELSRFPDGAGPTGRKAT